MAGRLFFHKYCRAKITKVFILFKIMFVLSPALFFLNFLLYLTTPLPLPIEIGCHIQSETYLLTRKICNTLRNKTL